VGSNLFVRHHRVSQFSLKNSGEAFSVFTMIINDTVAHASPWDGGAEDKTPTVSLAISLATMMAFLSKPLNEQHACHCGFIAMG
jgi:hypothetical protein